MRKKTPRKRPKLNPDYWIEPEYKKHVIAWCRCYKRWKYRLMDLRNSMKAIEYDKDKIQTSGNFDQTADIAIKCEELEKKIRLIEDTARMVEPDMAFWIIKGVTDEYVSCKDLEAQGMPCSRNTYSRMTDKFYYLISKEIEI